METRLRIILFTLAFISIITTATGGYFYYSFTYNSALDEAFRKGETRAKITASRVSSKIRQHQNIARALAGHKEMKEALVKKTIESIEAANKILDLFRDGFMVDVCYLMDRDGNTIASSNRNAPDSFVGKNYAFRPYFKEAMKGNPYTYMALGVTSKKRGIYHSHPVYDNVSNHPIGVAVVKVPIKFIEDDLLEITEGTVMLIDPHGVVFASNQNKWLFNVLWKISEEEQRQIIKSRQFGNRPLKWAGLYRDSINEAHDIKNQKYITHEVLIENFPGWKILYLVDFAGIKNRYITPFMKTVTYTAGGISVSVVLMVLLLFIRAQREIKERKMAEEKLEKAYSELEDKVKERTADLDKANKNLLKEIEERKKIQEALAHSEAKFKKLYQEFRTLLENIPDNITIISPDLKILWANQAVINRFNDRKIEGMYCYKLWHGRDEPCNPCPVIRAFNKGTLQQETKKTSDGRIWDIRSVPIKDSKGEVLNVIQIGRDITEHRRLEERLRTAEKMEAVGQLAGGVAHDFNNRLTAIINNAFLLRKKIQEGAEVDDLIERIMQLSTRAAKTAQDLLAFSRKLYVETSPISLNTIVNDVRPILENFLREDIKLVINLSPKEPIVMANQTMIEDVIVNLVTNARDAMPDGGTLTIETDEVEIDGNFISTHGFGTIGKYGLLTVSDTGIGMDEETRQRVFEPFFTTKDVGKGTGLGLATTYGIIKQHKGYINVYSEVGKGTTFRIYLPSAQTG